MRLFKWILNTLFPPYCVSCKTEGDFLCKKCVQSLVKKKISPGRQSSQNPPEFQYLDGVIYALDYAKNPQIKAAIEQFKYRFTEELAHYFGELLAEKIGELGMTQNRCIHLIPVPLHRKRLFYRGFNQAELIAQALQKNSVTHPVQIDSLLTRLRHTEQQAKLNRWERQNNLRNAFSLNKKFVQEGKEEALYFLVDDVCTTGATLENCAKALKENGFSKVYGLVVARAFR